VPHGAIRIVEGTPPPRMKRSLFLAPFVFAACVLFGGEPASVTFENSQYLLAKTTVRADGVVINDYVKAGESIDSATTSLQVMHWPKASTINEAINPWLQSIRIQLTKKWNAMQTPNARTESDVIIEAWLMSAGDTKVQAVLQRFVAEEGGGVKAYRYAERIDPENENAKRDFAQKKFQHTEHLGELKLEVFREGA
jgi:hypothetical protein